MPFQKGRARTGGRAKGTLNHSTSDIRALALKSAPDAIRHLQKLMNSSEQESTRVAACKELLDRSIGKAAQPQTGADGESPVEIRHVISWEK
jgi:hypothetical protein